MLTLPYGLFTTFKRLQNLFIKIINKNAYYSKKIWQPVSHFQNQLQLLPVVSSFPVAI